MALYRKWRSQTLGEVIGQEHVVQTLRHAILQDRIAHAYLFTGPRGVGKTSMARLLAKAVNCSAPPAERPCGECELCKAISEGRAVDVIEMDAASHTSVEDAREIIERVQFRPSVGRKKVYVIDEVHMLSTAAFNALLKTLEEPPDHAIFILATTEGHKVPATILSRCQRFTFKRHTMAAIARHIQHVANQEGVSLEPGVAEAIARSATGSMRDALGVLEQLISFSAGTITLEQVRSVLGMSSEAEVTALIEALIQGHLASALRTVNEVAEQGVDMRQFARDLVERLRALLLLVATDHQFLPEVSEDELVVLKRWAEQLRVGQLKHWVQVFSGLDYALRTNPYGHLPFELAVIEAIIGPSPSTNASSPFPPSYSTLPTQSVPSTQEPQQSIPTPTLSIPPQTSEVPHPAQVELSSALVGWEPAEPTSRVRKKRVGTAVDTNHPAAQSAAWELGGDISQPPNGPSPSVSPTPPADASQVSLGQVKEVWPMVLMDMRPKDQVVQALLRDAQPCGVEGHIVVLMTKSEFHQKQIEFQSNRLMVEELLRKYLSVPVTIRCTVGQQSRKTLNRNVIIREIRKDPIVRAAINIFSADIVAIQERGEE